MRRLTLFAVVLLTACVGPRTVRYDGAPSYAPTDPRSVQILESMPAGATVLGDVDGVGTTGMVIGPAALESARKGAAAMGADAIVIVGHGTEPIVGDIFGRDYQVVRVKAVRLAK